MVFNQTQNSQIKNNLIDELKLNPSVDVIPSVVNPTIQPVFEVSPRKTAIVRTATRTTTGASTIFTTPSDKDFYLVSVCTSLQKDASCDSANGAMAQLGVTVDGSSQQICAISGITLTAQANTMSMSFPEPVKVDRNTTITITGGAFTAGVLIKSGTIVGFTQETAIKTV